MTNRTLPTFMLGSIAVLAVSVAPAAEIKGTIGSTLNITEDSWLTGDVSCRVQGAPCLRVTASNLTVWLNGFTITGMGDPPEGCIPGGFATNLEHAIEVTGQKSVQVLGPGLIQNARGWGIFLGGNTTQSAVKEITVSNNCLTGVQLWEGTNDNVIEGVVAVRNGNKESGCGGICLLRSNNNHFRRNVLSGNGYAVAALNFGLALSGRGNTASDNIITGNVTGIHITAASTDNVVYRNVISGNPPIQIPVSVPEYRGYDIRNLSQEGTNTILDNMCVTYSGLGSSPCPSLGPYLIASPNPITIAASSSYGITTINWNSQAAQAIEIRIGSPNGTLFAKGENRGSAQTGLWVTDNMIFYLQDVTAGKALTAANTLATLVVRKKL